MRLINTIIFIGLSYFSFGQSTIEGSFVHDGITRTYILRLPDNISVSSPVPLVFNFHGFSSNAGQQQLYSFMNSVADRERFAVCYPEGIGNAWNVDWSFGSTADDVGFINRLIDDLTVRYNLDPKRVFSCGMSNGGFFSYRLACELNTKIAAIASVTGSMVPEYIDKCKPNKAVPILEIHGTSDGTVDYNGSNIGLAIPTVLEFWRQNNGCQSIPTKSDIPNINVSDNTTTEVFQYPDCRDNTEVVHYKVLNGAHTWPGSFIQLGNTSQDFKASEVIWEFFKKYNIDGLISSSDDVSESNGLRIFPNPTSDQITIADANGGDIYLLGWDGKEQLMISKAYGTTSLDLSNLSAGAYIICVDKNGNRKYQRLIKL